MGTENNLSLWKKIVVVIFIGSCVLALVASALYLIYIITTAVGVLTFIVGLLAVTIIVLGDITLSNGLNNG